MNAKNILMIAAKNAVNALLVAGPAMGIDGDHFNFHNWAGALHVMALFGNVILAREAVVWGPVLLKWSTTDANPNGNEPKA